MDDEGGGSVGHVLDVIRRAGGITRADNNEQTGLSRSTVATRLDTQQPAGLITSATSLPDGRTALSRNPRDISGRTRRPVRQPIAR